MTIQEEIRRDVYIITLDYFSKITEALEGDGNELPDETLADELLAYLHSQGVVIKAPMREITADQLVQDTYRDEFTAVQPLIEDKPE